MKLWIGLALIALLLVAIINLEDNGRSDAKPLLAAESMEVLKITAPKKVAVRIRHKAKRSEENFVVRHEADPTEQPATVDLPKWAGGTPAESNSMLELKNVREEDRTDRPLLMVTYGDVPKPNFKLEHRELGNYNDANANVKTSSGYVATDE